MKKPSFFEKFNLEFIEKGMGRRVFKINLDVLLVALAILVYTVFFSFFTILRHYEFGTHAWDLGIFNQSFWTTIHDGKLFYSTAELLINPSGSFFGTHFSPILFILLPVYAAYRAPQSLLVFQSLIMSLGAVPLYKLAARVTKYRVVAFSFVLVYLLYPPLQGINWFDFHVQSFLPLFFFSAFYFLEKQSWKSYFLFIVLSLMCEEHSAIIVVFIGLFMFLQHRKHLLSEIKRKNLKDVIFLVSFLTIALGILWYLMTVAVRNIFFPVNPDFVSTFKAAGNWRILGVEDPVMIPLYVLRFPVRAITALSYDIPLKAGYLLALFGPLAFLSFFKMRYMLPAIPWFVYALFSNYQPYYLIFFQYPAYVIAFIFIAAVYAIGHGGADLRSIKKRSATLLTFGFISFLILSPLGPVVAILHPDSGIRPVSNRDDLINKLLTYIPPEASVMADNALFPHVSSRDNAFVIPTIAPIWNGRVSECKNYTNTILRKVDYVVVDTKTDRLASSVVFSLMQENHDFGALVSADGAVLFKRNYKGSATMLSPYDDIYDYTRLSLYAGELIEVPNSTSKLVMHFNGSFGDSPMFWYGPRDPLPPGVYNVTMRLKVNGTDELFEMDICTNGGQTVLFSRIYFITDFAKRSEWTNQTFPFLVNQPLADFEVRATYISHSADIYLDYIDLEQITT
jgi:uncharacterized membrane protein